MKSLILHLPRLLASLCLLVSLLPVNASAANKWWDNNGTSAATSGTWDTTSSKWATSSTLTASTTTFANGDFPEFAAGSGTIASLTITVNSPVTCAGMASGLSGALVTTTTFSGSGAIAITSTGGGGVGGVQQGFFCGNGTTGNFVYNVPITGSGGIIQNGNGYIALYANNNYSGGTSLTGGQLIYYNQNNSFGSGTITVGGSGNALVNSGSAGVLIPNNFSFPTAGYLINLASGPNSGSTPGTTYSGNFPLPSSGTTTLETGGAGQVTQIGGVISGASALTVNNGGSLWLSGLNTYSGATTIASSTALSILGSGDLGNSGGNGSYASAIANSGTFTWNSSASQTLSGAFTSSGGTFNVSGSGTLTLSGSADNVSLGATINNGAKLILAKASTGSVHALGSATTVNSGGTLQLSGTGGDQIYSGVTVTVASGGVFDLNGQTESFNILNLAGTGIGGTGALINNTGTSTLTASGGIVLTATTTIGGSGNITIPSAIGGSGIGLTKGGSTGSILTLSGLNTFSGVLTFNAGTVVFTTPPSGSGGNLGNPSGITFGGSSTTTLVTSSGAGSVTISSPTITANTSSTALFKNGAAAGTIFEISAQITGPGNCKQNTPTTTGAIVRFSNNNNNYTGNFTMGAGTVEYTSVANASSPAALGGSAITAYAVANSTSAATLRYVGTGNTTTTRNIDWQGTTGPLTLDNTGAGSVQFLGSGNLKSGSGAASLTLRGSNTGANTLAQGIADVGGATTLTKSDAGTWVLSGANTYSGGTTVSAGTLQLSGSGTLGSTGGALSLTGATLDLGGTSQTQGPVAISGASTLANGTLTGSSFSATPASGITATISANLAGSAVALSHTGLGTLTLLGANTYDGGTTIGAAGTLLITNDTALGNASAGLSFSGSGILAATNNAAPVTNTVTLSSSRTITVNSGMFANFYTPDTNNLVVAAKITGAGGNVLKKSSSFSLGTVRFSNDTSDYTGDFTAGYGNTEFTSVANQGTPSSLGAGAAGTGGQITLNNASSSGTLRYVGAGNSSTLRPLNWTGTTATYTLDASGSGTVQFLASGNLRSGTGGIEELRLRGTSTGANTLAQVVNDNAGATSLTKLDAGQWVLSGANTYSGATTVSGGTLALTGSGSINNSANIIDNATFDCSGVSSVPYNLANGQTLSGTGNVVGQLKVAGGATLAPGTSGTIGTLSCNNSLTLAGTASMKINKAAGPVLTSDKVVVTSGTLTYGGTLTVTATGITLAAGDTFTLFSLSGNGFAGTFAAYNLPALPSGLVWDVSRLPVNGSISVSTAPTISTQPSSQTACAGSTATFSVAASGGPCTTNYSWAQHNNSGWGSPWTIGASGGGTFLASAANNNSGNPNCNSFSPYADINTPGGNSLGLYGGSGGESVSRVFPNALTSGQVFSIDMDNGNVDSGQQNGFALQTAGGTFLFSFYFLGGQGNYKYFDTSEHDTGIGFTRTGLRIQVIVGSGNIYNLVVTPCGGSPSSFSATFPNTGVPGKVVLFNNNGSGGSANDLYFNSLIAGGAVDNADNYSGNYSGQDKGDQPIATGNGGSTYTTPPLTVADNGAQYEVVVYGCAGAVVSSTAALAVNPSPTVAVNSETLCANALPATVTASASGGTLPYQYAWTVPVGAANPGNVATFSATVAGTYSVTVSDANSCSGSGSGTLAVNPNPTVAVNSPTVCASALPATITASVSSGTGPYSYVWTVPIGAADPGNVASFSASSLGIYTVTVSDANSCGGSGSGTLTVNPNPTVAVNSPTVCSSDLPATITAVPGGGTGPYGYAWTVPVGAVNPGNVPGFSASVPGVYSVLVTDGNACGAAGSGTLTVNPNPVVTTDVTNQNACAGSQVTWSVAATGTGLTFQWQRDGTNLLETIENFTGTTNATLTNSAVAAEDGVDAAHGYLCLITSGSCSSTSATGALEVDPAPFGGTAIPVAALMCPNNSGTNITVSGFSGTLQKWQASTDGGFTWTDIASIANPLPTGSLGLTTQFRAVFQSGVCTPANSTVATVTVSDTTPPMVSGGSIATCYTTQAAAEADAIAATSVSDNCDPNPVVTAATVGACDATITVTATDASGNHASTQYLTHIVSPPVFGPITAMEASANVKDCATTTVQGTVNLSVPVSSSCGLTGGRPTIAMANGLATDTPVYDGESPAGTFNYHWDVTALTSNGTWTVTITAADTCQSVSSQFLLCMNNAQISGQVQLEGFVGTGTVPLHTRSVAFVATDGAGAGANVLKTWTLTLSNESGDTFAYTLSDAPRGTRGLSAVTAWNLRSKLPVTLDADGQATGVNFTASKMLRGGDFDGSNITSFDDYSVLQSDFFSFNPVPDITGDGQVDFDDYAIFAGNWELTGDPE